jgi:hypothetical protein
MPLVLSFSLQVQASIQSMRALRRPAQSPIPPRFSTIPHKRQWFSGKIHRCHQATNSMGPAFDSRLAQTFCLFFCILPHFVPLSRPPFWILLAISINTVKVPPSTPKSLYSTLDSIIGSVELVQLKMEQSLKAHKCTRDGSSARTLSRLLY